MEQASLHPMKASTEAANRAGLVCLSVPGCRVPLPLLEALSFARDEIQDALLDPQRRAGASQLCLIATCERVELYATSIGEAGRSVAAAAVQIAAVEDGGDLKGRRVLVVGAGEVATQVADSAARLGAAVTVCNRTRRRADCFVNAGATVVDLGRLLDVLSTADVAIFGTAAPDPLVNAAQLDGIRCARAQRLLVIDLCVPRNVDPSVRARSGVRLLDLADLRMTGAVENEAVTRDVARRSRSSTRSLPAICAGWRGDSAAD
jgi:glutamyl-tRNA reductase